MANFNWKETAGKWKERLRFLRLDEDPDDEEEDGFQIEEREFAPGRDLPEGNLKEQLEKRRKRTMYTRIFLAVLAAAVIGGFILYNRYHTFRDYIIAETMEMEEVSGTGYVSAGKKLYRYNSDGISCISRKNETEWSITYSMQAPIADVCGTTMAVVEQQGTQVYVVNEDGLIGTFETLMPILKVRVSRQGVVALILQDEEGITWVNLYSADGTAVVNDKTTVGESGYPMDIDISPDGQKLAVSYLKVDEGVLSSRVVFYHFGSAGKDKEDNIVSSFDYTEQVIPQIYFTGNDRAAAVSDSGFYVYKGSSEPKESEYVSFDREIISCFHDEETIGFLFLNESGDEEYRMELYNYSGKQKVSRNIDAKFDEIKIENGQILMYSDKGFDVFTESGVLRFSSAYEKEVDGFFYFGEFRKYLVITKDSFDKIRIN